MHDEEAHRSPLRVTVHLDADHSDPLHIRLSPQHIRNMQNPNADVSLPVGQIELVEENRVANGVEIAGTSRPFALVRHGLCRFLGHGVLHRLCLRGQRIRYGAEAEP